MPRITDNLFAAESVKLEQDRLLHFIDISVPSVGTNVATTEYLVDSNENITWRGTSYTAFPLQFSGGFTMSSDGSIDKATLSLANPERLIMHYIDAYGGLRDATITVYTIYEKFVDSNPSSYVVDYFVVDSYSATDTVLTLRLDPSINLDRKLPRTAFYSNSCRFTYKDPATCKYSGELPSCKKTLEDCKEHVKDIAGASGTATVTIVSGIYYAASSAIPANVKPGQLIVINNKSYTISTGKSAAGKISFLGDNTITTGSFAFKIQAGNTKNFGGFPGIPNGTRRLIL